MKKTSQQCSKAPKHIWVSTGRFSHTATGAEIGNEKCRCCGAEKSYYTKTGKAYTR